MPLWLATLPIERMRTLEIVYAVTGVLLLVLLVPAPGVLARRGRWSIALVTVAALSGGFGALLVWWIGDVQDLFGVQLSVVVHLAVIGLFAGIGVVVVNLVRTRWWRKVVAGIALPGVLLAAGLMINEDFAYFPSFGDVFGVTGVNPLAASAVGHRDVPLAKWRPPADMPTAGLVATITIPAAESHFAARPAWIYLPPAAQVRRPPKLPVVIGLSGQPGFPSDLFEAGHLDSTMNAIADAHHGVAPIVVVPDQLGSPSKNPMCVNSKLGRVATYLTVDVRDWVLRHEPVSVARTDWTVAGFSEGGTCAVQLAAAYPAIFGSFVDVSGEIAPKNGDLAQTIDRGFAGSKSDYEHATPLWLLGHHHYPKTRAIFAVGQNDAHYGPVLPVLARAAREAGMVVTTRVVPHTAHDWHAATDGLSFGMYELLHWWGIQT